MATRKGRAKAGTGRSEAKTYRHPEAESLLRPDVGVQAQFRKRKPPVTYRYDSSLSPELDWDGQNLARERGEALIAQILEAESLDKAKAAAHELKALSKPFLNWAGKAERLSFDVPTLPLFVHERLSTKAIIETLKGHKISAGFSEALSFRFEFNGQTYSPGPNAHWKTTRAGLERLANRGRIERRGSQLSYVRCVIQTELFRPHPRVAINRTTV